MADQLLCSAPNCIKAARANRHKLCSMHEARLRRGGSLEPRRPKKPISDLLRGKSSFGWWAVLGEGAPYSRRSPAGTRHSDGVQRTVSCRCECGTVRDVPAQTLLSGKSRHCGCKMRVINPALHGTHLMCGKPEYRTWAKMKERCSNPNCADWANYGGRGIVVCDRWSASFEAFYEDMGDRPSRRHSIDRIDVNGNYEPGNCRWATPRQQMQNVRCNRIVVFQGEQMPLISACRQAGIEHRYKAIHQRITKGQSFHEALAKEGDNLA